MTQWISFSHAKKIFRIPGDILVIALTLFITNKAINLPYHKYTPNSESIRKYSSVKDLQLWIKENLDSEDIVMLLPGERESLQGGEAKFSSFGSPRMWLHDGWLYTSNKDKFEEGMSRFKLFTDVDLNDYLYDDNGAIANVDNGSKMRAHLNRSYHKQDKHWFENITRKYKVTYYVFERKL